MKTSGSLGLYLGDNRIAGMLHESGYPCESVDELEEAADRVGALHDVVVPWLEEQGMLFESRTEDLPFTARVMFEGEEYEFEHPLRRFHRLLSVCEQEEVSGPVRERVFCELEIYVHNFILRTACGEFHIGERTPAELRDDAEECLKRCLRNNVIRKKWRDMIMKKLQEIEHKLPGSDLLLQYYDP